MLPAPRAQRDETVPSGLSSICPGESIAESPKSVSFTSSMPSGDPVPGTMST